MRHCYIDSNIEAFTDGSAISKLSLDNDTKYNSTRGVVSVDRDRWVTAQGYEKKTWMQHQIDVNNDHNDINARWFDEYNLLRGRSFNNVIEIGCGPFTNMRYILKCITCNLVTLLDPLINEYITHPNCSYKNKTLENVDVELIQSSMEEYDTDKKYDLVVMINVLEHCMDADKVLSNILNILSDDGVLVFCESTAKPNITEYLYDAGHPIRICESVVSDFVQNFDLQFYNKYPASNEWSNEYTCFIGTLR